MATDPGAPTAAALVAAAKRLDPVPTLGRLADEQGAIPILRALASLQDGQFATAQARALGMTKTAVRWLATTGETVSMRVGVWRFCSTAGDPDPAVTAWLRCWPHGVVARQSAAWRHGLVKTPPSEPQLWVPRGVTRRPVGIEVRVTRSLAPVDLKMFGGVPYTTLARTVCDLCDPADPWATLTYVDDAVALGARPKWINACTRRLGTRGRAGLWLVSAATAPGAAERFRSWLERASSHVYRAAGLPEPEWNVRVHDQDGKRIGEVDALWREWRVVSEKEGLRFHTTPTQRRRDADRFNRLLDAGYAPRRFTWHDVVTRPVHVASTVARALAAAGANVDPRRIPPVIAIPEAPYSHSIVPGGFEVMS